MKKNNFKSLLSERDKQALKSSAPIILSEAIEIQTQLKNAPVISAKFASSFYRSGSSIFTDYYKPISQC